MELNERETLIKVETQLKDSVKNQSLIMSDLKEIFQRIESDSKKVTSLDGKIGGHMETSKIRWENIEKDMSDLKNSINDVSKNMEINKGNVADLKTDQSSFKESIKSAVHTVKLFMTIATTICTLIGGAAIIITILDKLK